MEGPFLVEVLSLGGVLALWLHDFFGFFGEGEGADGGGVVACSH